MWRPLGWLRRAFHREPELGFCEVTTSGRVADELQRVGVDEVHRGLAGTGVVATIRRGSSSRAIGIRSDMDALPVLEASEHGHASSRSGVMHACGHDGHMAILLAAAREIVRKACFDGTVHLIFQPAEEGLGGARRMIDDGLFERFPMDAVFALHNWPGLAVGKAAIRSGAMMAAVDRFEITVRGLGAHAAQPDLGVDPIVAASQIVLALQTVVSRTCAPQTAAVVSVTEFHAGSAFNVIPESALLKGTVRTVQPKLRRVVEQRIRTIAVACCEAHGASCEIRYVNGPPATINAPGETEAMRFAAVAALGAQNVEAPEHSAMTGEDFAWYLLERPGAFIWLGNGDSAGLHNPRYDFLRRCDRPGRRPLEGAGGNPPSSRLIGEEATWVMAIPDQPSGGRVAGKVAAVTGGARRDRPCDRRGALRRGCQGRGHDQV